MKSPLKFGLHKNYRIKLYYVKYAINPIGTRHKDPGPGQNPDKSWVILRVVNNLQLE